MSTIRLGGREVTRLGFGAMRVTGPNVLGPPEDRAGAVRLLRRAVELGVQVIDTAESYGPGVSEELIAEALHPYPDGLVVATKGGTIHEAPGQWTPNGSPQALRASCEASLRRLRVDRIALYQLHTPDPRVPLEESVGALRDLREEGKIELVGLSNVSVGELERAQEIVPIVSVQNRYSLADRSSEDVLERCERDGLAFLPWFPLGRGELATGGRLREVASRLGATPAQVALAWLLRRSPAMLPIPGTSSVAHLEENVAAARLRLGDEDFVALGNRR
jgi:aryl-alcohol dehydrogenase-like predicted oxidoreductase